MNDDILNEIVERELAMFLATPNEGGQADCQQRPETFRLMRKMAHIAHGGEYLRSYLEDLREAEKSGRNFMIEKYALMDERIPPLCQSPLLDEIADAETAFMAEAAKLEPRLIRSNGGNMFRRYLRAELQTLSPKSLALYATEIRQAQKNGENPVVQRHHWLARQLGKEDLVSAGKSQ